MKRILFAVVLVVLAAPAFADEQSIELKAGTGLEAVQGNCGSCHSLDYIKMNSPFLNHAGWQAEVTKMIKTYGAPITDEDAKAILDYLATNYGG
jgi:mono/diheme cytochrome c family protein